MNEAVLSRLSITFFVGFDDDSNEVFQTRHFRNVKTDVSNESVLMTAQAIASLQQYELEKIERSNTYELYE